MKTFNSFQMVAGFAALPFGLAWVKSQAFTGSGIAFWVGCVIYLISFFGMVAAVRIGVDKWDF
jgi:hypothetical protein